MIIHQAGGESVAPGWWMVAILLEWPEKFVLQADLYFSDVFTVCGHLKDTTDCGKLYELCSIVLCSESLRFLVDFPD